jgi:hypothetical protein
MENYWTEMEVDRSYTSYTIQMERNSYSDGVMFSPRHARFAKHHETLPDSVEGSVETLLKGANPRIIVIFKACESELMDVMATLKNCVAVAHRGVMEREQHHIYAIEWAPALAYWYASRHYDLGPGHLPNDMWLAVDGKVMELESMCKTCDRRLRKTMDLCHFLHSSCVRADWKPLSWDFLASYGDWFEKHQPHYDALGTLALRHKPVKEVSVHDAFKKPSFNSLSTDPGEWESRKDELSSRSATAARTRRVRDSLCPTCVRRTQNRRDAKACSSSGGRRCVGPILKEDFVYGYASTCVPWMLHALLLCERNLDMRAIVPHWRGSRIKDYRILGPTAASPSLNSDMKGDSGNKRMLVAKVGKSIIDHAVVSYERLTAFAGEKRVERFEQLRACMPRPDKVDRVNGLATHSMLLAAARALATSCAGYWRPPGTISDRKLMQVRVREDEVDLCYSLPRFYEDKICLQAVNDVYKIPGNSYRAQHCESPYRKRENELWREVVIKRGIKVTADVWRKLFSEQNWVSTELPDDGKLRKLVRAAMRKVKKENEEKRKKEADARRMKKSLTAKAAGIAS